MRVKIKEVLEVADKTSKASKPYKLTTFKGEDDKLYRDVYGELQIGQELEGEWKTDQYGTKFEVARSGGGGGSRNDPQRQSSIEWQSARRDAVDYCIAKSRLLFDLKKTKEAEEELSGKHIFQVALYFKGIETGATQLKNKKEELPEKQIDEPEDRNDDSAKDDMKDEESISDEDVNKAFDEV